MLEIAFVEYGPSDGDAVILLHGFPYDARAYDEVAPTIADDGRRVLVPWLRGYGPTRFLSDETFRSGQQAALGHDLLAFMDALEISKATLVGYDWGGRAACIVAALWPERVRHLVSCASFYNIQDIAASAVPSSAEEEHRFWYQYYFHTPRGRAGLELRRNEFCELLWRLWSPCWPFDAATFDRTAASFENPDFVDIVIHSYRHRFGYAPGDPTLDPIEARLASGTSISAPTILLQGGDDGVDPWTEGDERRPRGFTSVHDHRVLPRIGHNVPQEAPHDVVAAIRDLFATHP